MAHSSQPSKKSKTLALNSPCAIIEKWSQPGMTTALAPGMASARPCGEPASWSRAPAITRVGRRIAKRLAGEGRARSARAGGQRQPVLLLLIGEVAEAFQHRVDDLVGRGRFHGLGHGVGLAPRLEDLAADARDHQVIDAAAVIHRRRQRDVRAHREAQKMGALDAGMVHQGEHVPGHCCAIVAGGIVRLGALAMAAAVQGEAAQALACDGVVPAHALPVLIAVGREAMHQHDRLAAVGGTEFVVGERQAVGRELSHNFP